MHAEQEKKKTDFECFRQHFPDLLLGEGARTFHDLFGLASLLLFASTSARADGAAEDFWAPPAIDGALAVMEAHD